MDITEQSIIGEVVADNYRYAGVFKSAGIDFCCTGNRTIREACDRKSISAKDLLEKLQKAAASGASGSTDYQSWDLDLLADYIEKKHHRYVQDAALEIRPYLDKVCRVHGPQHPELMEINTHFTATVGELTMHMKKEELVLFPFIKKMAKAKQDNTKIGPPHFGTIQNPIDMMMQEHVTEGDRFRKITELSSNYTPPMDACNTYRVTYALLSEFEQDLHLHIHLENNILFPKSIELEKSVVSN